MTATPEQLRATVDQRTAGWPAADREALWRKLQRGLIRATPGALASAADPATVHTPALDLIDRALVDLDQGTTRRVIITLPPQEGKSTRAARFGSAWALLRDPDRRVAIASYGSELAAGHGRFVRDLLETYGPDAIGHGGTLLFEDLPVDRASRAASRWDLVGRRGGMYSVGIGGGLTGRPVDWLCIDDPVKDREQADSPVYREKVWEWWTNVAIPRLSPEGVVVLIMTRWHEDDLAGRLIAEGGWHVIAIPAEAEEGDVLGREPGEFLESARRRTREQWEEIRRTVGARVWAALYQGHPTPVEGGLFSWDWIRPYRTTHPPELARVVTAVDTTAGGSDEAGIVTAGRGPDRRLYVLGDNSGPYTAGGQWRAAWFAVLDHDSDALVYESNLVDPMMRKAVPAAWRRLREQAGALAVAGLVSRETGDVTDAELREVADTLRGSGDDDVTAADDPLTALVDQLREALPYAARVLASPEQGPARVTGVRATRGKVTRAEPVSQAYETGKASHVGAFPALEREMVTWQEGQASPNRVDALVWSWYELMVGSTPARAASAAGRARVATGTEAAGRSR